MQQGDFKPIRTKPWPTYDKGDVFIHEDDIRAATAALEGRLYFRYDCRSISETEVGKLEASLETVLGAKHALAVSSGTAAITLGLLAAGVPRGSLVACSAFTFAATPSSILLAGCHPLLIGCDQNLHLDLADLKRKVSPEVRAIVVVHMRGFGSDIRSVCDLAREREIPVIEDAVPALGVRHDGRALGTFGTVGAFSTQSDKSINTGEGGFITCDDDEIFAKAVALSGAFEGRSARHLRRVMANFSDLDYPLFSFRMDEIRGALARSQLIRLPQRLALLRRNYRYIVEGIAGLGMLHVREPVVADSYLGDSLIFRLPGASVGDVGLFVRELCANGIQARGLGLPSDLNIRSFWNWRFLFPDRSPEATRAMLPETSRYLSEAIDIPLSTSLTREDCDDLIAAVTFSVERRRSASAHRAAVGTLGAP